jgi:hypothetical protein
VALTGCVENDFSQSTATSFSNASLLVDRAGRMQFLAAINAAPVAVHSSLTFAQTEGMDGERNANLSVSQQGTGVFRSIAYSSNAQTPFTQMRVVFRANGVVEFTVQLLNTYVECSGSAQALAFSESSQIIAPRLEEFLIRGATGATQFEGNAVQNTAGALSWAHTGINTANQAPQLQATHLSLNLNTGLLAAGNSLDASSHMALSNAQLRGLDGFSYIEQYSSSKKMVQMGLNNTSIFLERLSPQNNLVFKLNPSISISSQ